MLRTFNCGVGFVLVVSREGKEGCSTPHLPTLPCYGNRKDNKGDRKMYNERKTQLALIS